MQLPAKQLTLATGFSGSNPDLSVLLRSHTFGCELRRNLKEGPAKREHESIHAQQTRPLRSSSRPNFHSGAPKELVEGSAKLPNESFEAKQTRPLRHYWPHQISVVIHLHQRECSVSFPVLFFLKKSLSSCPHSAPINPF